MKPSKVKANQPLPRINIEFWDDKQCVVIEADMKEEKLSPRLVRCKKFADEKRSRSDCTVLQAIRNNRPEDIPRLVQENGLNVNDISHNGAPVLHEAAFDGKIECVKALLDCGASVNSLDREDWSPLHAAVLGGHIDLVSLLIQRGADLYAETSEKYIPFQIAIEKRDEAMISILVEKMASLSAWKCKQ